MANENDKCHVRNESANPSPFNLSLVICEEEGNVSKVKVGLIGSQFEAEIHAESFKRVADAELAAAASPTEAHVKELARKHGIRHWFTDYKKLLEMDEISLVALSVPNDVHCPITLDCAAAGKHVIVEKP